MTFEEFGLSEDVMRGLDAMNFKEATLFRNKPFL